MTTNNKDLSIKETILGVLKARDLEGNGVIHSSDFRMALSDLGFEMGSRVVEDILVLCKVDSQGNLDFSTLEHELIRARRVLNSTAPPEKPPPTSKGAQPKPWTADVVHEQKLKAEKQKKMVQEFRPQIQEAYQKYARGTLNGEQLKSFIQSLGIELTRDFDYRMRQNSTGDLSFADLIKALISFDASASSTADPGFCAGSSGGFVKASPPSRKRVDWNKCKGQLEAAEPAGRLCRRPAETASVLRASEGVKGAVFSSSKASTDFTTVSALHDASGQGSNPQVRYTTEQKVIREQVLAALRKLAAGELSMQEFHKIVFNMGIELPEVVVTLLERSLRTGHLEMHKVIQLLDGAVFKVLAAENVVDPSELERIRRDFVAKMRGKGAGSISSLTKLFADSDRDGNGVLSFSEFKKLCKDFGVCGRGNTNNSLTDNDLRLLFLDYDTDGSGNIEFVEFKNAIRGTISAKRRNLVQLGFRKIDRQGSGNVAWSYFEQNWDASYHPDVQSGRKTAGMVMKDCKTYCKEGSGGLCLSYVEFVDIFTDLSAMVESDEEFNAVVRNSFGLDANFAPPVLDYTCHAAGSNLSNRTPMARQAHGDCITWSQEECTLEKMENAKNLVPIRKASTYARNGSDPVLWPSADLGDPNDAVDREFAAGGSYKMNKERAMARNKSNVTCFSWAQNKKPTDSDDKPRASNVVSLSGTGVTTGQGHLNSTSGTASSRYFPDDHVAAGKNHKVAEVNGFSRSEGGSKWSDYKQREYSSGTPFGIDPNAMDLRTSNGAYGGKEATNSRVTSIRKGSDGSGGNVKSLAELLASRSQ